MASQHKWYPTPRDFISSPSVNWVTGDKNQQLSQTRRRRRWIRRTNKWQWCGWCGFSLRLVGWFHYSATWWWWWPPIVPSHLSTMTDSTDEDKQSALYHIHQTNTRNQETRSHAGSASSTACPSWLKQWERQWQEGEQNKVWVLKCIYYCASHCRLKMDTFRGTIILSNVTLIRGANRDKGEIHYPPSSLNNHRHRHQVFLLGVAMVLRPYRGEIRGKGCRKRAESMHTITWFVHQDN